MRTANPWITFALLGGFFTALFGAVLRIPASAVIAMIVLAWLVIWLVAGLCNAAHQENEP